MIQARNMPTGPDNRRSTYAAILKEHVVDAWFPRCIDRTYGGFLSSFNARWTPTGASEKLLEFQARQTLAAAELSGALGHNEALREAVRAGFDFLSGAMWDQSDGGWYWLVDREGAPLRNEVKHLHGIAYAIEACLAVHDATGEPKALELAKSGFEWMDGCAHDARHGGYFELLHRDGKPVLDGSEVSMTADHIGTPLGLKDMNVHSDLVETLTYAGNTIEAPAIRSRLDELLDITLTRFASPDRPPYFFFERDWTPASTYVRPATAAQTASRLLEARSLAVNGEALVEAALRLTEWAVEQGWNEAFQGFIFDRYADRPVSGRQSVNVLWWVQVDVLKALEYCLDINPEFEPGRRYADRLLETLMRDFLDTRDGGFFQYSRKRLSPIDRFLPTRTRRTVTEKANIWKDASHEARALLRLSQRNRLDPIAPSR
jgi:mannobiose 2-epimerase